jgi:3-methyladenine DNA glycosylase/8-oxoguanine DNA glycosylase
LPEAALRAVPGVGPWTTSCLAFHTWGDPDAVPEGDAGIPSRVAWALARQRRADDATMLRLLEPFRPHRYRVVRLVMRAPAPPRHGPRGVPHDVRRR